MELYRTRIIDSLIEKRLQSKGAILIEGPKWCGKTTTAEQFANTKVMLAKPNVRETIQSLIEIDSEEALKGEPPVLLDEWQTVPKLWDAIRYSVDHRQKFGQFILTGSAVPNRKDEIEIQHSGTGRFSWMKMRTMSLFESGESNGGVSLKELFDSTDKILTKSELTLRDIAFLLCRGGWPVSVSMEREDALEQAFDYVEAVIKEDIIRVDGVKRSSERMLRLLRSYARNQGSQCSIETLREDLKVNEATNFDDKTIVSYLDALRKIFVIEDIESWNPNLRSKTAIRTANTRYFIDPSIATAALRLGPEDLLKDLNTMGLIFETLCMRDLRVYAESMKGDVFHYRDKNGLECDAVIHLRNGRYALIEIKLGGKSLIEEGAKTLNSLEQQIDTSKMYHPSFKMVLTATGDYAYKRKEDNIYIVPIGCLRP